MTPAIEAVVFDLDGVLVDTELQHLEATKALVAPAELLVEEYKTFIGGGPYLEWMEATYGIRLEEFESRYTALFLEELAREVIEPLDGARELIATLRARGLALAVASQSSRAWIEATLAAVALDRAFDAIATAQDTRSKPAPDVYLDAAGRLGVAPASCLAIEDSAHGVRAAVEAGMVVVQSRQSSFPQPPQAGVAAVIDTLRAFELGWLDHPPARR